MDTVKPVKSITASTTTATSTTIERSTVLLFL